MIRISLFSRKSFGGKFGLIFAELSKRKILKLIAEPFKVLSTPANLSFPRKDSVFKEARMASIPYAAHSASKIHEHMKAKFAYDEENHDEPTTKLFRQTSFGLDKVLTNYNSKLMNSIWGQYNLYAAHAFQKNNESASGLDFFKVPQVKNLWDLLRNAQQMKVNS